jgi:hypothetical protein
LIRVALLGAHGCSSHFGSFEPVFLWLFEPIFPGFPVVIGLRIAGSGVLRNGKRASRVGSPEEGLILPSFADAVLREEVSSRTSSDVASGMPVVPTETKPTLSR